MSGCLWHAHNNSPPRAGRPGTRTGPHGTASPAGQSPALPQSESAHTAWRERPSQPLREPYEPEPWKQHPYQNYPDQQEYQEYRVYEEHSQHQHQQYLQQQQHLPHPQHLQHPQHQQYQQPSHATWDANAITAAQHDWDGILSQWEATTSPTPPLSAPGQGGV